MNDKMKITEYWILSTDDINLELVTPPSEHNYTNLLTGPVLLLIYLHQKDIGNYTMNAEHLNIDFI